MKSFLYISTSAIAVTALSVAANADNYMTLFGGWSSPEDFSDIRLTSSSGSSGPNYWTKQLSQATYSHTHGPSTIHAFTFGANVFSTTSATWATHVDGSIDASDGFVVGAAFGRTDDRGFRYELELAYRKHDLDATAEYYFSSHWSGTRYYTFHSNLYWHYLGSATAPASGVFISYSLTVTGAGGFFQTAYGTTAISGQKYLTTTAKDSGDMTAFSIMANVWFDLGANTGQMHPYLGGGIGWADVDVDLGSFGSTSDSGLAYQFGLGVGFDLPNSGHRINLEYRYFAVNDLSLDVGGVDLNYDYQVNEIIVGYRMSF